MAGVKLTVLPFKAEKVMGNYARVFLLLDNDQAGLRATQQLLTRGNQFTDLAFHYKNYKDLNELLVRERKLQQQLKTHHKYSRTRSMDF